MNKYGCLIFDFDGTLADTSEGIVQTVLGTLRRMGLPPVEPDAIRKSIGLALRDSLRQGAKVPEDRIEEGVDVYHEVFDEVALEYIHLFDGVKETLEALAAMDYRLAIATSRSSPSLNFLLREHGIHHLFSVLATVDCVSRPKPAPDTVNYVLERMGVKPDDALVIGDTTFDIMMGANAGCHTCGVSYGNHSAEMLATASPDHILSDMRELLKIV